MINTTMYAHEYLLFSGGFRGRALGAIAPTSKKIFDFSKQKRPKKWIDINSNKLQNTVYYKNRPRSKKILDAPLLGVCEFCCVYLQAILLSIYHEENYLVFSNINLFTWINDAWHFLSRKHIFVFHVSICIRSLSLTYFVFVYTLPLFFSVLCISSCDDKWENIKLIFLYMKILHIRVVTDLWRGR